RIDGRLPLRPDVGKVAGIQSHPDHDQKQHDHQCCENQRKSFFVPHSLHSGPPSTNWCTAHNWSALCSRHCSHRVGICNSFAWCERSSKNSEPSRQTTSSVGTMKNCSCLGLLPAGIPSTPFHHKTSP